MKKKSTLLFVTLSLVAVFIVASVSLSLFSFAQPNTQYVIYGNGATAFLQLPPTSNTTAGAPAHPINLKIYVGHFEQQSSYGAYDTMFVELWVPANNGYVTVAIIGDNPTHDNAITKAAFNNTQIWTSGLFPNVFAVADSELQVNHYDSQRGYGDIITANLTRAVNVSLPFNLLPASNVRSSWGNLSFTLPPMSLRFQGFGDEFKVESTTNLPKPSLSGWSFKSTEWQTPAWVQVSIPQWLGNSPFDASGHLNLCRTVLFYPV